MLVPGEYRASAAFSILGTADAPDALAPYRDELLETAASSLAKPGTATKALWAVAENPPGSGLELTFQAPDREQAEAAARDLANAYQQRLEATAQAARSNRTEGERLLDERLARMRADLSRALREQQDTEAGLPSDDSLRSREDAFGELARQRRDLTTRRRDLEQAVHHLDELKNTPLPENPPVAPEARRQAMLADRDLQQDLAELKVRLATVRSAVLEVWQTSAPILDELVAAAGNLERVGQGKTADKAESTKRAALEKVSDAASAYYERLTTFARVWTRECVGLQQAEIDPTSPAVLEAQERIAQLLGDYLYSASQTLTELREQAQRLADESGDQARHHAVVADLVRDFQSLQAAHHRFEFAASAVRQADNFHIAGAIQSAQGLQWRTRRRQEGIERRLEQEARKAAAAGRQTQIAAAEAEVARLRTAGDATVDALLGVQDRLEGTTHAADRYLGAKAAAAARTQRIAELTAEIDHTERALAALTASRAIPIRPDAVRLDGCQVAATSAGLHRRLACGWAAGATMFLLLMMGSRLMAGRSRG